MFAACVLGISFDKARAFDLGSETSQGQGQVKVVREQLMTEDTKDVELSVDDVTDRICAHFHNCSAILTVVIFYNFRNILFNCRISFAELTPVPCSCLRLAFDGVLSSFLHLHLALFFCHIETYDRSCVKTSSLLCMMLPSVL